jgi:glycosyltransferase involved in cell wall biosynthesis
VAQLPNVFLVIAGAGEQRKAVQETGDRLLPGRFQLMTLPRSRMPELYRAADVFLHMSQDEPSANAYIEALASGLPIVTHDRYVTRWTLEDQALLVNTSDESAVVAAVAKALQMKSPTAVSARRKIVEERFAWSTIAEQYCKFFESIR